jgi:hypothetical protein
METEDLLHKLEAELAQVKEELKALKELVLAHINKHSDVEKFKEKLNDFA